MLRSISCPFPAVIFCVLFASSARADEGVSESWPQWRGPSRDSRFDGAEWPSSVDEKALQQKWRVDLGPSYSGPIVHGDRIFVTETKDREKEIVRALDRKTGEELWQTEWKGSMRVPFFAWSNGSWIRSTGGALDLLTNRADQAELGMLSRHRVLD